MPNVLTILSWPDYVAPETIRQFEQETGARVNIEVVPSAVEMLERVRAAGEPPDVLCPPDYVVWELASEGRLLALDHARLPNLANIERRFLRGRPHDPESHYSVIKDWGTTGFMYRTDLVDEAPESWADFWTLAARYSGRVTVLDSPGEVIGAALKMRGRSYNSADRVALEQARVDLLRLKPHLLAFETDYRPLVASGDAYLALGWNGDAAALAVEGVPVRYVVPSEGSQMWEDDWAIAANAPQPKLAHLFLDFVMRPDVAAREAMYTRYATGNRAAFDLLDAALRNDPALYVPEELLVRLETGLPLDAEGAARREAIWREVRG
jgi:spermidine/putrescine transport system substrate-binding protein